MENKKEIRKQMKAYRAGLKTEKKKQMDQVILTHFFEIERVQNAQHFFVYTSFGTEIDTISLIKMLWKEGRHVYVPKVNGREMDFYEITSMQDLKKGYRDILEPIDTLLPVHGISGIMVMPGLAFDRMGDVYADKYFTTYDAGKSFYDRYIASQKNSLYKVAFAYYKQVFSKITVQEHDQTADCIVTECETIMQDT
jgi:5-formyltetrahydrofolate cyclo-ligase